MTFKSAAFCLMVSVSSLACSDDADSDGSPDSNTESADLVDTAVQAGQFDTLVAAVQAADLEATLRGPGPFTVFAPTDAAFAALPAGTIDTLLMPENKPALAGILTYHVVSGRLTAEEVTSRTSVTTVQGGSLPIAVSGSSVRIGDANVVAVDVAAENGVIHVIDKVLLPE